MGEAICGCSFAGGGGGGGGVTDLGRFGVGGARVGMDDGRSFGEPGRAGERFPVGDPDPVGDGGDPTRGEPPS